MRKAPVLRLALLVGGGVALLGLPFVLVWNPGSTEAWLMWAGMAGLAGGLSFLVLHRLVYRRLNEIYDILLELKEERLPDYPGTREADPIRGIRRTILELTGSLREEFAKLRRSELIRTDFIGDVSHELKTPIFAVQGFIETLLDGAIEDENVNRKFLKRALGNVHRLNKLVQDLLEVSRLEAGQLKMESEEFPLYETVLDAVQSLQHHKKDLTNPDNIRIQSAGLERQYVCGDRTRIQQVVFNLIDNALKYGSSDGQVLLELQADEAGKVWTCVDNEGEIPEEHLSRIFERFYRIEKSRSRANGGTGLGLSIVKHLVEAHGEELSVQSREGHTRFCFSLPGVEQAA